MIHRSYFIKRHSETVTVRNYRIAHCSLKDKFVVLFIIIFGSLPFPIRAEYCDERVCLSVCLSVCPQACLRDYNFCVCFLCVDRGSVLLCRRCDTLCTSGFVDDVIFTHTLQWMHVDTVAASDVTASSCAG